MDISTAGLTQIIRTQLGELRAANPRVSQRTLGESDAPGIAKAVRAALAQADEGDVRVEVRQYGGFVPNGYKYRAESDECTVTVDLTTGEIKVVARRSHAQSRARGIGNLTVARIAREGQVQGRNVSV